MAKALGKYTEYGTFNDRGYWWKNAVNPETAMRICVIQPVTL